MKYNCQVMKCMSCMQICIESSTEELSWLQSILSGKMQGNCCFFPVSTTERHIECKWKQNTSMSCKGLSMGCTWVGKNQQKYFAGNWQRIWKCLSWGNPFGKWCKMWDWCIMSRGTHTPHKSKWACQQSTYRGTAWRRLSCRENRIHQRRKMPRFHHHDSILSTWWYLRTLHRAIDSSGSCNPTWLRSTLWGSRECKHPMSPTQSSSNLPRSVSNTHCSADEKGTGSSGTCRRTYTWGSSLSGIWTAPSTPRSLRITR